MRNSFVVLLWLLLVSSPLSAWACDMSCSIHRMHSGCQTVKSTTTDNQAPMSMSEDMDMSSDQSEPMIGPHTRLNATPSHPMSMFSETGMSSKRFELPTQPRSDTTATPDHSKNVSSCTQEVCSQVPASASPPRPDLYQPHHQLWMATRVVSPQSLYIDFHRIRLETPTSKILAADRLTSTLRI